MTTNKMENTEELQPLKIDGMTFRSPAVNHFNYRAFFLFWMQKVFPEIEGGMSSFLPRFKKLIGDTQAGEKVFVYSRFYEDFFSPPSWEGYGRELEVLKLISQTDSKLKTLMDYENQNHKDKNLQESAKYKAEIMSEFYTLRDDFFQWTIDFGLDKEWIRSYAVRTLCNGQTIIKPSLNFISGMMTYTEEKLQNHIQLYELRLKKDKSQIKSGKQNIKPTFPDAFIFPEIFEIYSNEQDFENRAIEAYRQHIQNYIKNLKLILSEQYLSTRGNQPNFTNDVKILIAWNQGASVSQIEKVFNLSKDGIKSVKKRCEKVELPVRKNSNGRGTKPKINEARIAFLKGFSANNDELSDWLR